MAIRCETAGEGRERDGRAEVLTSIIVGTIDPPQFGVCWGLVGGGRTDALMWELGRLSDPYRFSFFPDICVIGRRSCVMEALPSCEERGHLFRGNARASRVLTSHESELMYFASCLGGGGKEREMGGSGVVESFMHAQSDNRERESVARTRTQQQLMLWGAASSLHDVRP